MTMTTLNHFQIREWHVASMEEEEFSAIPGKEQEAIIKLRKSSWLREGEHLFFFGSSNPEVVQAIIHLKKTAGAKEKGIQVVLFGSSNPEVAQATIY